MGIGRALGGSKTVLKRKFRWWLKIPEVSKDSIGAIPPLRGARPILTFKEYGAQHLNEEIFFPMKPDWKPIQLTLYDVALKEHPVIKWISKIYDIDGETASHEWNPSVIPGLSKFKKTAFLELYDGCGTIIEKWKYENVWPQVIDFGELDMGSSEIAMVTITLRYDRAYWIKGV